MQADYEAVVPDDPATPGGPPGPPELISGLGDGMEVGGFFRHVEERRDTSGMSSTRRTSTWR